MNIPITYMWPATMFDMHELQFLVTIQTSILRIFYVWFPLSADQETAKRVGDDNIMQQ